MDKLTDEEFEEVVQYVRQVLDEYNEPLGALFHALFNEVREGRKIVEIQFYPDQRLYTCPRCDTVAPWCGASIDTSGPVHLVTMSDGDRFCSHCGVKIIWKGST